VSKQDVCERKASPVAPVKPSVRTVFHFSGSSAVGSALGSGPRGPRFKSGLPEKNKKYEIRNKKANLINNFNKNSDLKRSAPVKISRRKP
jgi:hypothetical protein